MNQEISKFFVRKRPNFELNVKIENDLDIIGSIESFQTIETFMDSQTLENPPKKLKMEPTAEKPIAKCSHCSKSYSSKYTLNVHIKRTHPQTVTSKLFSCTLCSFTFTTKSGIECHLKNKHTEKETIKFECDFDGKFFDSRARLLLHMKSHLMTINCELCGLELKPTSLKTHLQYFHSTVRNFPCKICQKSFKSASALIAHKINHNKQFECEICDKKFRRASEVTKHKTEVHENPKSLSCETCAKKFSQKSALKLHQRIHEWRVMNLKCNRCDYATDNKSNYTRHLKVHEKKDARIAAIENPVKCEKCPALLKNRNSYNCHQFTVHPKVIYQCDLCGIYLKLKSGVIGHINRHIIKRTMNGL